MDFWDFFALLIWSFLFVMYLMVLFHIFGDLFRDPEVGGGAKALWTIGLIFLPFLLMLIYLVVRGRGMAERQAGAIRQAQTETDRYIKSVAGSSSPADQIFLGEGAARQRVDHAGRVRPAEGQGTRLTEGSSPARPRMRPQPRRVASSPSRQSHRHPASKANPRPVIAQRRNDVRGIGHLDALNRPVN